MAVNMKEVEKEVARYKNVISTWSAEALKEMIRYNNSAFHAGIAISPSSKKEKLIKSLVDYHRADVIRREEHAAIYGCMHSIAFKNKAARTRFLKHFDHIQFKTIDAAPDSYDAIDYACNPGLDGQRCFEYSLVFTGEISDAMRKRITSCKSIIRVVSILNIKE